ncbi:MAG: hypothetical protein ACLU9Q_01030 [Marvinbryantia sp.]|uniref:hypothetical protein n=1 Tax=Marvinbryantia sp. TaxID=2496532 RepID=UPI0025E14E8E|nr:hypothetical protein [uncultured Marvinbryantia sp.]
MKRKRFVLLSAALCMMAPSGICFAEEDGAFSGESVGIISDYAAVRETSYLQQLDVSIPIFDGPGYDNNYVRNIERSTLYTIVEEEMDGEGNLWGRLKSGAGWVDLERARAAENDPGPVAIYFAGDTLPENEEFLEYSEGDSWYPERIAFQANEPLTDISFLFLVPGEDYEDGEALCVINALEEGEIFVAEVSFPGDMTAYGLTCTAEDGTEHRYTVSISGRNGSLVIIEEAAASSF